MLREDLEDLGFKVHDEIPEEEGFNNGPIFICDGRGHGGVCLIQQADVVCLSYDQAHQLQGILYRLLHGLK